MWLNYAEKKRYLKENGLQEAGDTVGGSRDEVFKGLKEKKDAEYEKARTDHRINFLKKELSQWDMKSGKRKYPETEKLED
jgi:hypothetical protein